MKKYFNRFEKKPNEGITLLGIAKAAVAACGKDWEEVTHISFRHLFTQAEYLEEWDEWYEEEHEKDSSVFNKKDFEAACGGVWVHPFAAESLFNEDAPYRPFDYRNALNGRIYGRDWSIAFDEKLQKWTCREEKIQYGKHSKFNEEFFELVTEFVLDDDEYNEEHHLKKLEKEQNSWMYRYFIFLRAIFLSKFRKSPLAVEA